MKQPWIKRVIEHPLYLFLTVISLLVGLFFYSIQFHSLMTKSNSLGDTSLMRRLRKPISVDTTYKKDIGAKIKEIESKLEIIQDIKSSDDTIKKSSSLKLLNFNIQRGDSIFFKPSSALHTREPPPTKGYGKLAIRSFCNYCYGPLNIHIYKLDSSNTYVTGGSVSPMYDSTRKKFTTFITELLPGKYKLDMYYVNQGRSYETVKILAGGTRLYAYTRINPFGLGNGQIGLMNDGQSNKWKIDIYAVAYGGIVESTRSYGIVKLQHGQGFFVNLPSATYKIKATNVYSTNADLNPNADSAWVMLSVGQRVVKPLD